MRYLQSGRIRVATAVVLALTLATTAAACGRGGTGSSASGAAKIAIVTRDFTNPYWAALRDGAIAEGKKQGVTVNVQAGDNETDSSGENAKISTLAGQNYTCFGVVPVNATNVITPLVPVAQKKHSDPESGYPDRPGCLQSRWCLVRLFHRLRQPAGRYARGPVAAVQGRKRKRGDSAGHRR